LIPGGQVLNRAGHRLHVRRTFAYRNAALDLVFFAAAFSLSTSRSNLQAPVAVLISVATSLTDSLFARGLGINPRYFADYAFCLKLILNQLLVLRIVFDRKNPQWVPHDHLLPILTSSCFPAVAH
jgi:hypothetical protein